MKKNFMKKIKKIFSLCSILTLFISCDMATIKNLPYLLGEDTNYVAENRNREVKKKLAMKDFSNIKNPLLFTVCITDIKKDKNKQISYLDGSLYVVVDLDSNKVFDYCYNNSNSSELLIKDIKNSTYILPEVDGYSYFTSYNPKPQKKILSKREKLFYSPVLETSSSIIPLMTIDKENCNTKRMTFYFVDINNPSLNISQTFDIDYFFTPSSLIKDSQNNYYTNIEFNGKCEIVKLSFSSNGVSKKVLTSFPSSYKVVGQCDNYLFIAKNKENEGSVFIYDKDKTENFIKEINIKYPKPYSNSNISPSSICSVVKVLDNYYVLSKSVLKTSSDIYYTVTKIFVDGRSEIILDGIFTGVGDDIKVIENKIYLFGNDISSFNYRYIDVEKKECSKLFKIDFEKILIPFYEKQR